MEERDLRDKVPHAGNNPNVQSSEGAINPSAPSTGTAGWGNTRDEKRAQVGQNNAPASSPDTEAAGDIRHTSYPQNETAQNPAAHEGSSSQRKHSLGCSQKDCNWNVTGHTEEEVLGYMRAHAREAHGKNEFTPKEMADVRKSIHKQAA